MQHEPIVVTGAGCVSALDHSVVAFWSALQDGRCGLSKLEQAAPSDLKVSIVGAIPAPDPRDTRSPAMSGRFRLIQINAPAGAHAQMSREAVGHLL